MSFRNTFLILLLVALVAAGIFLTRRFEGNPPEIDLEALNAPIGAPGKKLLLQVEDEGSGLASLDIAVIQGATQASLGSERFPTTLVGGSAERAASFELQIDPKPMGFKTGAAILRIESRDASLRSKLAGNLAQLEVPLQFDLDPPRITVESGLTYVQQGGSGAVRYRVNEPTQRDGVAVGTHFYPGYPGGPLASDNDFTRVALFAVPMSESVDTPIRVVATDVAGNEASSSWPVRVAANPLKEVTLDLSDSFLRNKVASLASETGVQESDPVAAFQQINERVRAENEQTIRSKLTHASKPLWRGAFQQWPGSSVMSTFGEHRRYRVDGRVVSEAIHSGYDFAKTAGDTVVAANSGIVSFAGTIGIYGNCVMIDHGMGLTSLYGHLSQIEVEVGQPVEQGSPLGRSGSTGLAGGDHLHFALLVGDTYVTPLEWLDAHWVRTHIDPAFASGPR